MTRDEAINWIINISADIGKAEHSDLWHYEQALSEIRETLEQECEKCIFRPFKQFQPEPQWIPCSEPPEKDGVYIVYAPDYRGGSSSAKECYDGVMFSKYKNGKWSIEHGYYNRPNCVQAWRELSEPWRGESQ